MAPLLVVWSGCGLQSAIGPIGGYVAPERRGHPGRHARENATATSTSPTGTVITAVHDQVATITARPAATSTGPRGASSKPHS